MDEQEWDGICLLALLVHVMNIECAKAFDRNVASELRQLVDLVFRLAPIVAVPPTLHKPLDVHERGTVFPTSVLEFVWESCELEFLAQGVDFRVGNVQLEWLLWSDRHFLLCSEDRCARPGTASTSGAYAGREAVK